MSHSVLLLHEALDVVRRLGYHVRAEATPSGASGACLFRGEKWLFLDMAEGPVEQLATVCDVLRREDAVTQTALSEPLRRKLSAATLAEK